MVATPLGVQVRCLAAHMKKIEKLTAEQEALLPAKRDEWIRTGLNTQPANRPEAERGVRLAYEAAGLEPPRFIIWVDSPYAGAFAQALAPQIIAEVSAFGLKPDQVWDQVGDQVWAQVRDQVGDQVGDQVWAQVRDQVGDQVRAQVGAQVRAQVRDQVGDQVRAQVRDQVGDQVWAQVRDQVWDQVRDQVGDQVWAQVRDQVWDQVRAQVRAQVWAQVRDWPSALISDYYAIWWSSWIDTMSALGVDGLMPWDGQRIVAQNAYWWWAFKHFAVISERPREIHRDEEGRLHAENGPAISWPDGWGFHSWHGTRVPEWVITSPTVDRAITEPNSEVRRAAFERIGWADAIDTLVQAHGARLIDTQPDPGNSPNLLELYTLPEEIYEEPVNLLLMVNGSPDRSGRIRRYGETVPAGITDAVAAASWQYGVPTDVYAGLARRT